MASGQQSNRAAVASFIGTTIEWYDFYIYGLAAALVFGPLFFTGNSSYIQTLSAFGTFAVGFFARPIGGLLFGNLGDRIGRARAMGVSILFYSMFAGLGAFVKTQEQMLVLRLIVGLGAGGVWPNAVALVDPVAIPIWSLKERAEREGMEASPALWPRFWRRRRGGDTRRLQLTKARQA